MSEQEMHIIAGWIDTVVDAVTHSDERTMVRVAGEVAELAGGLPIPGAPA
jgi:glycine/serine hydroxymethyltransferase